MTKCMTNLYSNLNWYVRGREVDSLGKVLAAQTLGVEFGSPAPTYKLSKKACDSNANEHWEDRNRSLELYCQTAGANHGALDSISQNVG